MLIDMTSSREAILKILKFKKSELKCNMMVKKLLKVFIVILK
jgi:hypothetical protein